MGIDNLDSKIDWKEIYRDIKNQKIVKGGNELTGLCPFHADKTPSFGVDLKNGMYKCQACGASGNGTKYLSETLNIDSKEAYKILLKAAGEFKEPAEFNKNLKYTIEDYANDKRLPLEFLKDLKIKTAGKGISIPYLSESGEVLCRRQRYHAKANLRFTWTKGSKVNLYGLWLLKNIKESGKVILVEGESDSQTIWYHEMLALGVPGASTFRKAWAELLDGVDIYIHKEPDDGGQVFYNKVCDAFIEAGTKNNLYVFGTPGFKDPSDLHINDEENFKIKFEEAMNNATKVDLELHKLNVKELFTGCPVQLKQPYGWDLSDYGIKSIDKKTGDLDLICRTPLVLSRRLKSLDSGEEKIELAYKRDKKWNTCTMPRSTVFQSRSIVQLADVGVTVTSENARMLVKYLGDLEAENFEVLRTASSVSRMGWYGKNFLPGAAGELVLDVDIHSQKWVGAYQPKNELKDWVDAIQPFRDSSIFRFILAGAFAAPLLKIIGHRIFFIHNWGDSRAGKTAALKGSLSVWGDPEQLMTSFNATKVGLERLAGFFNDLPLGIDERQVAGNKQDQIDTIVYMLSMGTGKVRGAKAGGLQTQNQWRTIALTTGEEPLTSSSSQTGVYTRALQIFGSPFDKEDEAKKMHELSTTNFGTAGPAFIKILLGLDKEKIKARHKKLTEELTLKYPNKMGSHISSVALVTLADEIISSFIFKEDMKKSEKMMHDIIASLDEAESQDVNTLAWEYIKSWYFSNARNFTDDSYGQRLGILQKGGIYVFPHIFKKALEDGGYSPQKTMRAFAEKGQIGTGYNKRTGKTEMTVVKWLESRSTRVVDLRIEMESEEDKDIIPF